MGNRDRYKADLTHDGCSQSGEARVSESENPVLTRGRLEQSIDLIPEGFEQKGRDIACKKCGRIVWKGSARR